ncbi:hypothetical protein GGF46_000147 [Coemansia sp. RSA 552]|nr:hypothetical protein GGF46_000147 [Coemansia sp. RSA 552]
MAPRPPQRPPEPSPEDKHAIEKMAQAQVRNPELVHMVRESQRSNPRYQFLFEGSPLYPYFQWRVSQQRQSEDVPAAPPVLPALPMNRPPPPVPPPHMLQNQGPPQQEDPPAPATIEPDRQAPSPPKKSSHRYYELPASVMMEAMGEDYEPYEPLIPEDLEGADFLETIVQGLSTFTDCPPSPEITDELQQALSDFERGVRYIYQEGEFERQDGPSAAPAGGGEEKVLMDREGWTPGVVEKILWDRRKGSAERQKWRRKQDRARRRRVGPEAASESSSESESSSSESSSASSSSSDSGSDEAAAKPSNINTAIGSGNVGFKLLEKLGWQEGQGLGAASEGIVEPIRLSTRFSTVRTAPRGRGSAPRGRRGRGRGQPVARASLGTGRLAETSQKSETQDGPADDVFESFRRQMSSTYGKHQPDKLDE